MQIFSKIINFLNPYSYKGPVYSVGPNTFQELLKQFDEHKKEKTNEDIIRDYQVREALAGLEVDMLKMEPANVYKGHQYYIDHNGSDSFYIRSNWNAKNFQIMRANVKDYSRKHWKVYIAHRPQVLIEDFWPFERFLVLEERDKGVGQIQIIKEDSKRSGQNKQFIAFSEPCYEVNLKNNRNYQSPFIRYEFESLKRPPTLYDYDVEANVSTLLKEQKYNHYDSNRLS